MQVPNVKWEDVGGLEDVKKSILDTVQVGFLYAITLSEVTCHFSPLIWKYNFAFLFGIYLL